MPPYVIFHDQTLAEIARKRPASREALLAVGGVGQAKLERYGEAVLKVVAAETVARRRWPRRPPPRPRRFPE